MNTVSVRGLEISACHGVHNFEKITPQIFKFDIDISCDFYSAAKGDGLLNTISYSEVCATVLGVASGASCNLIEKLAYDCAFALFEKFPKATNIDISVWKPQAPVKAKMQTVGVNISLNRETVYLSLGSSMGDREKYLDKAVNLLAATPGIKLEKVSSFIKTQPYGGVAQNEFLNCAVKINTILSPHNLLSEIHKIEEQCGRTRNVRWEDRTLDIDIILYGNKKICDEYLTVPHADYLNRDFVLEPLRQIAPHLECFKN